MNRRVLVVDFDPQSAEATRRILAGNGFDVLLARSSPELEVHLFEGPPSLVVLEPMLPGEDGFALVSRFKRPKAGPPPIVIIASRFFKGPRYQAMARSAGADLFLARPEEDAVLLVTLQRASSGEGAHIPSGAFQRPAAAPQPAAPHGPAPGPVGATPPSGRTLAPAPAPPRTTAGREAGRPATTAATARSANRPAALADEEVDKLVNQLFNDWTPTGPVPPSPAAAARADVTATATAVETPPAPAHSALSGMDAESADMLFTLEELESGMPGAEAAVTGGNSASVPSFDRSVHEKAIDEAFDRVTGPQPAPNVRKPASVGSSQPAPQVEAEPEVMGRTLLGQPDSAEAGLSSPLKKVLPLLAAAIIVLAVGGFFMFKGGSSTKSTDTTTSAETAAPVEPAAAPVFPAEDGGTKVQPPPNPRRAAAENRPASPRPAPEAAAETAIVEAPAPTNRPAPTPAPSASPTAALPTIAPINAPKVTMPGMPASAPVQSSYAPSSSSAAEPAPPKAVEPPVKTAPAESAHTAPAPAETPAPPIAVESSAQVPPQVIPSSRVNPVYPRMALERGIQTEVLLQATILPDGSVGSIKVLRDPKPGYGFSQAAIAALKQWQFTPGTIAGKPAEMTTTISFKFK